MKFGVNLFSHTLYFFNLQYLVFLLSILGRKTQLSIKNAQVKISDFLKGHQAKISTF